MRKLKKYKKMLTIDNYTIVYERIKNTVNGAPRYEVSIFDSGYHKGTYNIVTYTVEESINNLIKSL
jgi:hypothetical protein|nr:MAG TPA: glycoprotein [Caudoviricetes sp.]